MTAGSERAFEIPRQAEVLENPLASGAETAAEMEEFLQFSEAQERPDETLKISEGRFAWNGFYSPGHVTEINPEAAEFDPELKELSSELDSWILQREPMSCAVASQTMAVNQLEHGNRDERELIEIGKENGWYNEGTYSTDVGKIAAELGMEVERFQNADASDLEIANQPEVKVLAAVDSTRLAYPESFKRCTPDHVVQVLRVEKGEQGDVVILNDPGREDGKGSVYPMDVFMKAFKGEITTIRKGAEA